MSLCLLAPDSRPRRRGCRRGLLRLPCITPPRPLPHRKEPQRGRRDTSTSHALATALAPSTPIRPEGSVLTSMSSRWTTSALPAASVGRSGRRSQPRAAGSANVRRGSGATALQANPRMAHKTRNPTRRTGCGAVVVHVDGIGPREAGSGAVVVHLDGIGCAGRDRVRLSSTWTETNPARRDRVRLSSTWTETVHAADLGGAPPARHRRLTHCHSSAPPRRLRTTGLTLELTLRADAVPIERSEPRHHAASAQVMQLFSLAPPAGLEPATLRLTAECSAN